MFLMHNELVTYLSSKGFDPKSGNSEVQLLTAFLLWKRHTAVHCGGSQPQGGSKHTHTPGTPRVSHTRVWGTCSLACCRVYVYTMLAIYTFVYHMNQYLARNNEVYNPSLWQLIKSLVWWLGMRIKSRNKSQRAASPLWLVSHKVIFSLNHVAWARNITRNLSQI